MKLKNKVAIVTGSTSGMGRATAVLFAREGAKVVISGRNEERAKEVVNQIKSEGFEAMYVLIDTSKIDDMKVLFDKTMEAYGTVDILFNNAGALSTKPVPEVSLEEWNSVFNVNVTSSLYLTQLVAPVMKEKGKGVIINTSSVAGFGAHHGSVAYVSSKHAMNGLTKSMAWELGPEIRVNAIAPGLIHTKMVDDFGGLGILEGMIQGSPLKRHGVPEDIANVALFLATDDSSFIDGQVIKVDGGVEI